MWILDFLPSWIFTLVTFIAIAGIVATEFFKFIPFIGANALPIRVISIIVLAFGLYMMGGSANQEKWEARVKELEAKVAVAEEKSKTANSEVASLVKQKQQIIKQQQIVIQDRIVRESAKIDSNCTVPAEAIQILNEAAGL